MSTEVKQYPWKFKICRKGDLGVEWWQTERTLGTDWYGYYFKVGFMDQDMRDALRKFGNEDEKWYKVLSGWPTVGLHKFWHDTIHAQLCLHWIVFYWSTPWTTVPKDFWK